MGGAALNQQNHREPGFVMILYPSSKASQSNFLSMTRSRTSLAESDDHVNLEVYTNLCCNQGKLLESSLFVLDIRRTLLRPLWVTIPSYIKIRVKFIEEMIPWYTSGWCGKIGRRANYWPCEKFGKLRRRTQYLKLFFFALSNSPTFQNTKMYVGKPKSGWSRYVCLIQKWPGPSWSTQIRPPDSPLFPVIMSPRADSI
jgi:hypothetical protein